MRTEGLGNRLCSLGSLLSLVVTSSLTSQVMGNTLNVLETPVWEAPRIWWRTVWEFVADFISSMIKDAKMLN